MLYTLDDRRVEFVGQRPPLRGARRDAHRQRSARTRGVGLVQGRHPRRQRPDHHRRRLQHPGRLGAAHGRRRPARPVGPAVIVGHQVMLHGCTVGEGSLIGIKAVVLNHAVVGRGVPDRRLCADSRRQGHSGPVAGDGHAGQGGPHADRRRSRRDARHRGRLRRQRPAVPGTFRARYCPPAPLANPRAGSAASNGRTPRTRPRRDRHAPLFPAHRHPAVDFIAACLTGLALAQSPDRKDEVVTESHPLAPFKRIEISGSAAVTLVQDTNGPLVTSCPRRRSRSRSRCRRKR